MGIASPGNRHELEAFLRQGQKPLVFKFFHYANIPRYIHQSSVEDFNHYYHNLLPTLTRNHDRIHGDQSLSIFERNKQLALMNGAVARREHVGSCIDQCHTVVAYMLEKGFSPLVMPIIIVLTIKKGEGAEEFNANHCMVGLIDPCYYPSFFRIARTGGFLKKSRTDPLTTPLALQQHWVHVVDPSLKQYYRIDSQWIKRIEDNWPDFDAKSIDQVSINYVYFFDVP